MLWILIIILLTLFSIPLCDHLICVHQTEMCSFNLFLICFLFQRDLISEMWVDCACPCAVLNSIFVLYFPWSPGGHLARETSAPILASSVRSISIHQSLNGTSHLLLENFLMPSLSHCSQGLMRGGPNFAKETGSHLYEMGLLTKRRAIRIVQL